MTLTYTDILFDLFIGVFYFYTILYSAYALMFLIKGKGALSIIILLTLMMLASGIYLFQTVFQALYGTSSSVRLWDVYNFVQVFANLIAVKALTRMIGRNLSDEHTIFNRLPLN